jgi:hypothetical protein
MEDDAVPDSEGEEYLPVVWNPVKKTPAPTNSISSFPVKPGKCTLLANTSSVPSTKESISSYSVAPPKAHPKPKLEDRVAARKTPLPSGPFTFGDVDADPFAPNYQLIHVLPSGLITSSATPLTYDDDLDPEDESEQAHGAHTLIHRQSDTSSAKHTASSDALPS